MKASFRIFSETLPRGGVFRFSSAAKGTQRSPRMGKRTSCLGDSPGFFNEGLFPVCFVKSHPFFFGTHSCNCTFSAASLQPFRFKFSVRTSLIRLITS